MNRLSDRLEGSRANSAWVVAAITLLAAALRIPELGQSLYGDELWTYVGATPSGLGEMLDFVRSDEEITPPLYTFIALLSAKLGEPSVLIRLPSVIAGVATIPLVYAIGLRTVGRRAGMLAALIAALSPFLAFYSVEARAYSLSVALVAASTLLMLLALERGKARWWVGYGLCSCAAMYTHYTSGFALAAQLIWLLWYFPAARVPALAANGAAALAFLPWLPGLLEDVGSPSRGFIELLAPFDLDNVIDFTGRWALGHPAPSFAEFWGAAAEAALLGGLAVAIAGLAYGSLRRTEADPGGGGDRIHGVLSQRRGLTLVWALALAGPIGCLLASVLSENMYFPRNLASSWPGWSIGLSALLLAGPVPARMISTGLVVGVLAVGAVSTTQSRWQRPDVDGAAALINAEASDGDIVLDALAPGSAGLPIAETLDVALAEPLETVEFTAASDVDRGVRAAAGRQLFVIGPPFLLDGIRRSPALADNEPEHERVFPGLLETGLLVYRIPAS